MSSSRNWPPGATMNDRRLHVMNEADDLRTLLMYEPRGHSSMSGAILQPPTRPDADWGVVYIEVRDPAAGELLECR